MRVSGPGITLSLCIYALIILSAAYASSRMGQKLKRDSNLWIYSQRRPVEWMLVDIQNNGVTILKLRMLGKEWNT